MSKATTKRSRGSVKKKGSKLVALWLPDPLARLVDKAVENGDTDRSKFIREAIRQHCRRNQSAA